MVSHSGVLEGVPVNNLSGYFVHGFHTLSVIKQTKFLLDGGPWDKIFKSNQIGVHDVICVSSGVLNIKNFEKHRSNPDFLFSQIFCPSLQACRDGT